VVTIHRSCNIHVYQASLFAASAGSIQLTVAAIVAVINIAVKNIIESIVLVITYHIACKILKIDHRFHCVIPFGNSVSELFFGKDENCYYFLGIIP